MSSDLIPGSLPVAFAVGDFGQIHVIPKTYSFTNIFFVYRDNLSYNISSVTWPPRPPPTPLLNRLPISLFFVWTLLPKSSKIG